MNPVKTLLRWINLHPIWRLPRMTVWRNQLRAPTFDRWLALCLHRIRLMGVADHEFLTRTIQPGMTVVDIGANQGLYSLLFANLVGPAGRVIAFEPDDMLFAALQENVEHNAAANVQPRHLALGSSPGQMTLYRSLLNSGDNRLARTASSAASREAVQIRVERLDRALADTPVHFIKMDVQGWEMEVFRGMDGLLNDPRNARISVFFEWWPQGLRDAGSDPLEPLNFLAAHGFVLQRTEAGQMGTLVVDLPVLVQNTRAGEYVNLYATRG